MLVLQVISFTKDRKNRSVQYDVNLFLRDLEDYVPSAKVKDVRLGDVEKGIETWYCVVELKKEDVDDFNEYYEKLYDEKSLT